MREEVVREYYAVTFAVEVMGNCRYSLLGLRTEAACVNGRFPHNQPFNNLESAKVTPSSEKYRTSVLLKPLKFAP